MLINADVMAGLAQLPDESVQCVVTSPPYWSLRDYGIEGQIGLEPTIEEFVAKMVAVFREVRRVLRHDGTLWLNLGDSYNGSGGRGGENTPTALAGSKQTTNKGSHKKIQSKVLDLKPKDLCGIPWRVAFTLQADGWYLRQDIIWHKPNPMPESVTDRCTKAHEYIFLMTKSAKYFWDQEAVREDATCAGRILDYTGDQKNNKTDKILQATRPKGRKIIVGKNRNRRSVWTIATQAYPEAHFATFPEALVVPCIQAGTKEGDTVLDPFFGAGTVGLVAKKLNRQWIGIEINPEYCKMALKRINAVHDSLFMAQTAGRLG